MYRTAIPRMYVCVRVCVCSIPSAVYTYIYTYVRVLDGAWGGVESTVYAVGGITRLKIAPDKFEFA